MVTCTSVTGRIGDGGYDGLVVVVLAAVGTVYHVNMGIVHRSVVSWTQVAASSSSIGSIDS